ncbi:MAG: metallophosphoesterase [Blastocatellia bacterium]
MREKLQAALFAAILLGAGLAASIRHDSTVHSSPMSAQAPLPEGAAPAGAVRFAAIGDMGTGDDAQAAVARRMAAFLSARPFDTVLTLGDNIYPDGNPADFSDKFERPYAELLRRGVRFYAVLGNHDVKKGREAEINYKPFHMGGRAYYSFTKGADGNMVEFFALDSTDFDTAQAQWTERALAASRARWKIVYFHHPIYSSGSKHGSDLKLRAKLEPLLVRHGVAAVFSGHDHIYERIKPQQGVQYFVSGAGGKLRRGDLNDKSPLTAAGHDESSSFMFVELTEDLMKFWAVDASGRILDSGAIAPRVIGGRAAAAK